MKTFSVLGWVVAIAALGCAREQTPQYGSPAANAAQSQAKTSAEPQKSAARASDSKSAGRAVDKGSGIGGRGSGDGLSHAIPDPGPSTPDPLSGTVEPKVSLQILDHAGIEKLVQSHKGKVVVMDVWATTCEPCVKEFPQLVALHRRYGDKIAALSVSLDFIGGADAKPEDQKEKVLAFLKKQGATLTNVLAGEPDTTMYEKLQIPSIPVVFVYRADGALVKRFGVEEAEFTYQNDVAPLVEKLVGR